MYLPNEVKDAICVYVSLTPHNLTRVSFIYFILWKKYYYNFFTTCWENSTSMYKYIVRYISSWKNNLPCIKFLTCTNYQFTIDAINLIVVYGNLNTIKWLCTHRNEGYTYSAVDNAAGHGHLDIVKYLYTNKLKWCTNHAIELTTLNGYLDVAKFLCKKGVGSCAYAMITAVRQGHIDIIKCLYKYNKYSNKNITQAMNAAVIYSHLDIVKFLYDKCNKHAIKYAIKLAKNKNHTDILNFLESPFL